MKLNRTKSFLPKKAVVTFVFSKLAFLIFGVIITASFFYVLSIQKEIQSFDEIVRTGEAITDITASVSASPFPVSIKYQPEFKGSIAVQNTSFMLQSKNRTVTLPIYYPINRSDQFQIDSCIQITKTDETVISGCQ